MVLALLACNKDEVNQEPVVYEGPLNWSDSIRTLYSDSAIVIVMVEAAKQVQFETGDLEFPEGIFISFYGKDGGISSTLKADHGYFFREENRYTGVGGIVVENIEDQSKLLTDTLHWSPPEKKVYTKAKVMIIEAADTLRGQGLEAAEDFSTYTILKPEGTTILNENQEADSEEDFDEEN